MEANEFATALEEMMNTYNSSRERWITRFGSDNGFNEWFTCKADGNDTKANELLTAKALGR